MPDERQESLQNIADAYFNVEIKTCTVLQALWLFISALN